VKGRASARADKIVPVSTLRFGVSTHLFHHARLDHEHLVEIAAHGFDCVEVFATRSHFDYHDAGSIHRLAEWLDDTRLALHSIHAPICASLVDGVWGEAYSNALLDDGRRLKALSEAQAALDVARIIPYRYLVVHLGVPDTLSPGSGDNNREAARRSVEALQAMAQQAGVTLALEVIPNAISTPESLVSLIEQDLDGARPGICMDVGHAFIMGEVADAIETCSGHLVTTHLHDNDGKADDHLPPGDGGVDWPLALMAMQKVGYDGTWLFEVANTTNPRTVLERTARARARFEEWLDLNFGA
jgi:sugar phosphate isomerase/epimerase